MVARFPLFKSDITIPITRAVDMDVAFVLIQDRKACWCSCPTDPEKGIVFRWRRGPGIVSVPQRNLIS